MLSPIVRDVQRQRCCKRGCGDGRDFVFMTTARLSDLSMLLKGKVRRSPEQSARQPIARSGKFSRRAYSRRALDCEKTTVSCFIPSWSTLLFERGLGEERRFDVAARSESQIFRCHVTICKQKDGHRPGWICRYFRGSRRAGNSNPVFPAQAVKNGN